MENKDRFTVKYFYTTGSNCTSSLAAVNACLSQSSNNIIYKYEVSSSEDLIASASDYIDLSSDRMSEAYGITFTPIFALEQFGTQTVPGMEFNRIREDAKLSVSQDTINGWFNIHSSSLG